MDGQIFTQSEKNKITCFCFPNVFGQVEVEEVFTLCSLRYRANLRDVKMWARLPQKASFNQLT